jgi:hypothetical protein
MSNTSDVPEIARLLGLATQWRAALKRMTPADITALSINTALRSAGVNLDLVELEAISEEMRAGVYPGKNVYDVILSPSFQERVSKAIVVEENSDSNQQVLQHSPDAAEDEILIVCKHCKMTSLYSNPQSL